ncbi:Uncharacterized protein BM_BM10094 [Brugia malayi]|uniref:Bm10094 n=1 Tax=Brugia malayi TaxID=6279 RepID=A0A0I9N867_BRUMA|nr:Uncharacterized protein BM_BM10094 [Brugia malayi]CTP81360.1 Bm10094 [Brugia malayi]VIO94145.1 Uncharacterized protein BM_BM10094 [Brugia malayi]
MSLMQFALLSWILVAGAENEIDLLIQRKKIETNEPIKISSSKNSFKTLEEMVDKMNEKLENNVKRRKDALVMNKIQIFVIVGIWVLLSLLWIACNVKIYLRRKRNVRKLEKHYQETTLQMLENKKQEIEKKSAKEKERQHGKQQMRNFRQTKGNDELTSTVNTEVRTSMEEETENVNEQSNCDTTADQGDTTRITKNYKRTLMEASVVQKSEKQEIENRNMLTGKNGKTTSEREENRQSVKERKKKKTLERKFKRQGEEIKKRDKAIDKNKNDERFK